MKKTPLQEAYKAYQANQTFGAKVSDGITKVVSSWPFIIGQTTLIVVWMSLNALAWAHHWDPYPFILLNSVFSVESAYAGPIVLMSQNRQDERDRYFAEADAQVNREARQEIEALQLKIAELEKRHLETITDMLEQLGAKCPAAADINNMPRP